MKLGGVRIKNKKSFINSTFFEFLIHLFLNSLIFANSLLDDPALREGILDPHWAPMYSSCRLEQKYKILLRENYFNSYNCEVELQSFFPNFCVGL